MARVWVEFAIRVVDRIFLCFCDFINPRAAEGGPRGSGVTGRAIWWCYSDNSSEVAGRNFFFPIGMGQGSVPACLARVSLRFVDLDYRSKSYDTIFLLLFKG